MQFYAFGPFKAEAMDKLAYESGIDLAASYAYTDSYTDLPMLEAVGHPVAVNPDRVLNRYAREHDFEILHFSQTVSLWSRVRDRLGAVPPRPANRGVRGAWPSGWEPPRRVGGWALAGATAEEPGASEDLSPREDASPRRRPGRRATRVSRAFLIIARS